MKNFKYLALLSGLLALPALGNVVSVYNRTGEKLSHAYINLIMCRNKNLCPGRNRKCKGQGLASGQTWTQDVGECGTRRISVKHNGEWSKHTVQGDRKNQYKDKQTFTVTKDGSGKIIINFS